MGTGIILQARLNSKRFPNKMLCPLGSKPVIQWTIEAVKKSGFPFVIAIPDKTTDKGLAEWIRLYDPKIEIFLGHPEDLILRFKQVLKFVDFDPIIRICGDNPFFNPTDILIANTLFKQRKRYTRINNVEIFSKKELDYVDKNDPFIVRREDCVNMLNQTVDYPEDIKRLENEM